VWLDHTKSQQHIGSNSATRPQRKRLRRPKFASLLTAARWEEHCHVEFCPCAPRNHHSNATIAASLRFPTAWSQSDADDRKDACPSRLPCSCRDPGSALLCLYLDFSTAFSGGGRGGSGAAEQGRRVVGVEHGRRQWKPPRSSAKYGRRSHGSWETRDGGYRQSGRCGYGGVAESRDDGPWKRPCWRRVSVTGFPNLAPPRHAPAAARPSIWRFRDGYEPPTAPIPMSTKIRIPPQRITAGGEIATQVRSPACDTQWHGNKQQACRRNSRPRRFTRTLPRTGRGQRAWPSGVAGSAEGRRLQIWSWPS
jgi:hypothetical protein